MHKKRFYLNAYSWIFILMCFGNLLFAQQRGVLTGVVQDAQAKDQKLIGATVILRNATDSTQIAGIQTDTVGRFSIQIPKGDSWLLNVRYVGYLSYWQLIKRSEIGKPIIIRLSQDTTIRQGVVIEERQIRVQQKEDTVEYHADSYKTKPDANVEDLVTKMPGITNESGTIKAQGEVIKKVTINGQDFFGDDATMALRNLPAEIVDRVQVYDRASDQSSFTGFDDGNSTKSINIITKSAKDQGTFGKVYAGGGSDDHYQAGANINLFKQKRRFSVLGMSNNINQQNFSMQDLTGALGGGGGYMMGGGPMRPSGGPPPNHARPSNPFNPEASSPSELSNFLSSPLSGISTSHAVALNYGNSWKKIAFAGSYFGSYIKNNANQSLNRSFFSTGDSALTYQELMSQITDNQNHRANVRIDFQIDSLNSIIYTGKVAWQQSHTNTGTIAQNRFPTQLLSTSSNHSDALLNAFSQSHSLLWRKKFSLRGRTLSVLMNWDGSQKPSKNTQTTQNHFYYQNTDSVYATTWPKEGDLTSQSPTMNITYTEPIKSWGLLQLSAQSALNNNFNKATTFISQSDSVIAKAIDTTLSNTYSLNFDKHTFGSTVRFKNTKYTGFFGLNYQASVLSDRQDFPNQNANQRIYHNILPNAMVNIKFSANSNLRLVYRTMLNQPGFQQMQELLNNANPVMLSIGNRDLKPEFTHFLVARYGYTNPKTAKSLFFFSMFRIVQNYVGSQTIFSSNEPTIVRGLTVQPNVQLSLPQNLSGYRFFRSMLTYALPVIPIKCNLNLNLSLAYTRTPGLLNTKQNFSTSYTITSGGVLSSNISEKVDFTLSVSPSYTIALNQLQPSRNNNYFSSINSLRANELVWKRFVLSQEVAHTAYFGLSPGYNPQFWLIGLGFGTQFFKNNAGELKLTVFDVLKQNNAVSRVVSDVYVDDIRTNVLTRYVMLTFTYRLRKFNTPQQPG
ncbi:MAG: outer membrane beta-barrel protein [Bacteroidia bacterium]|nr:outer membrane beta-barrel protein [Bacteroidia bacterium]